MRLAIFGSCVTRDAFELSGQSKVDYAIAVYLARTTINSALSPRPPIDQLTNASGGHRFEERCVAVDLLKLHFESLSQHEFDYLLVDLVDERHAILTSGDTCLCYSVPFVRMAQAHSIDTARFERRGALDPRTVERTVANIPRFVDRLAAIIPPSRVILHEALWAERFIDEDNKVAAFPKENDIRAMNEVLSTYYAKIRSESGAIRSIRPKAELRLGDAKHRWGLESFHYATPYYQDFLSQLADLASAKQAA